MKIKPWRITQPNPKAFGEIPVPVERNDSPIAIYRRVSTRPQVKRFGLDRQIKSCVSRLKKLGLPDFQLFTDEGKTGENFDRQEFQALCECISKDKVRVVIAYSLSRFSRNIQDFWPLLGKWGERKIRILTVLERFDSDEPLESQMRRLTSYAIRSDKIALRAATKARNAKVKKGGRGPGNVPYGYYALADGSVRIDKEKAEVVRRIFREHENKSDREIAESLYKVPRVRPPSQAPKEKPIKKWAHSTIAEILANPKYIGVWFYKDEKGEVHISKDVAPPIVERLSWCDRMEPQWVTLAKERGLIR